MTVKNTKFNISTNGFNDAIDITPKIKAIVSAFGVSSGIVNITLSASSAALITLKQEVGLINDINSLLETIVPLNKVYEHDIKWHEGNASACLKAALLGNNITLSLLEGQLQLPLYGQIVLLDFDTKPRERSVVVSVVY